MAIKNKNDGETPYQYFLRIKKAKKEILKAHMDNIPIPSEYQEFKDIPIDASLIRIEAMKDKKIIVCQSCGNPDMENSISPYECKRCWINNRKWSMGKENAEKRFDELIKKLGIKEVIEVEDLPF